jgi:large subunit ribosomal protein L17
MRHGDKINNLGRKVGHRTALLKNMANSLIEHKRITTTLAKAKALRRYIEPILTKAKDNTTHSRRVAFSYLQNKVTVTELFENIGAKIADRPGGYTRVIRMGFRRSDGSEMAMIELVDYNLDYTSGKSSSTGKKRRSRRGGGKSGQPTSTTATTNLVSGAAAVAAVTSAVEDKSEEE